MVYNFSIERLPKIENAYTVIRNTVWQVADPYHILIMVTEGECNIRINDKEYLLGKGSCTFIPAGQPYLRTPAGESMCRMTYVHFSVHSETKELENDAAAIKVGRLMSDAENALLGSKDVFIPPMTDIFLGVVSEPCENEISHICAKMEELLSGDISDNLLVLTVCLCEILALLSKNTLRKLSEKAIDTEIVKTPYNLKKAVWYIKQNYTGKISVEDLCRYCNISCSQLTRYFKTAFSTTPLQYIIEYKINRAKEMFLTSPELSVKSVSLALGFDDQHYFSRIFAKVSGETPSEYKYRVTHFVSDNE